MRRLCNLFLLPVLTSCAADSLDDHAYLEQAEMARIDGSVEDDGIFIDERHRDAHCAEHPESRWCSDIGALEQDWVSAEYHGKALDSPSGTACYSGSSSNANKDCLFPALKQMKIAFDTSRCYEAAPPGFTKPSASVVTKMIQGFKEGALSWNGVANGVTVEDGTCAWPTGCTYIEMSCEPIGSPGAQQFTDLSPQVRVSNLPAGPHGEDHIRAVVALTGTIKFNVFRVWSTIYTTCNQDGSDAEVLSMARHIGRHEMGHAFGFGHFGNTTQVMYPTAGQFCSSKPGIAQEYRDALAIFNSAGGAASILDQNLENYQP
ncbi:MAG TPA: hypothetical protein VMG12_29635 [Polyangiaceae bacterium]|nr:hypothetical protein [Polyangiaceae bacterium]